MARFYFHFANGQTILDDIGTDLPDLEAVRKEAIGTTRELMFDAASHFWAGEPYRLWVTDQPNAAGKTILSLQLSCQ
jgi:hypothetical protein